MTLIVAVVTRITAMHDIEIRNPVGGCGRERGRTFLIEAFKRCELRPERIDAFGAVTELKLVDTAVQTVAVNILPIGIDCRRGRRIARAPSQVDLTRSRPVLVRPDLRPRLAIEGDDAS